VCERGGRGAGGGAVTRRAARARAALPAAGDSRRSRSRRAPAGRRHDAAHRARRRSGGADGRGGAALGAVAARSGYDAAMKIAAVVLIVLGVISLAYGGISYTREKKVVDLGPLQASHTTQKTIPLH